MNQLVVGSNSIGRTIINDFSDYMTIKMYLNHYLHYLKLTYILKDIPNI